MDPKEYTEPSQTESDVSNLPFPLPEFLETPEINSLRDMLVADLSIDPRNSAVIEATWALFEAYTLRTIETLPTSEHIEAEVAFMLEKAFIFFDAGLWENCIKELEYTYLYASQYKQFNYTAKLLKDYIESLKTQLHIKIG